MLELNKRTTALIVVDLQNGILNPEPVPFGKDQIVTRSVSLGKAFAAAAMPIVLTTTDFAPGYADAPKGAADSPWVLPKDGLPAGFATLVPEVDALCRRPHRQAPDECFFWRRTRSPTSPPRLRHRRTLRRSDQPWH